jgi:hypothetical protein
LKIEREIPLWLKVRRNLEKPAFREVWARLKAKGKKRKGGEREKRKNQQVRNTWLVGLLTFAFFLGARHVIRFCVFCPWDGPFVRGSRSRVVDSGYLGEGICGNTG